MEDLEKRYRDNTRVLWFLHCRQFHNLILKILVEDTSSDLRDWAKEGLERRREDNKKKRRVLLHR